MNPKKIIIFGAGGHALVVADAIRACGDDVFGFVDAVSTERKKQIFYGARIIGGFDELIELSKDTEVEVAIGFGHCAARYKLICELKKYCISVRSVISPQATISNSAQLSDGVYVGPNAVIEANCNIGEGTIVNCGASVSHESIIGTAVAVCPGVRIGGKVFVGDKTWLGIGVTCLDRVRIGKADFIGAGAVVVSDIPDNCLVYGVPARVIRPANSEF